MMSLILEELSSSPNQHAGIPQNRAASGLNFESETAADGGTLSNRTKLLSLTNAIQTRYVVCSLLLLAAKAAQEFVMYIRPSVR